MSIKTPHSHLRGFTLIEIIVSTGLFSVVMLVVTAGYLTIITLDKEARATNELVTNLSFAVENIARNVRTGKAYACGAPGAGNGTCSQLSFTDSSGQTVTYLRKTDGVGGTAGTIGQCTSGACNGSVAVALTDPRISITTLVFRVTGVGSSDQAQPQVLMSIRGTMVASKGKTVDFTLQTSATQRELEI